MFVYLEGWAAIINAILWLPWSQCFVRFVLVTAGALPSSAWSGSRGSASDTATDSVRCPLLGGRRVPPLFFLLKICLFEWQRDLPTVDLLSK